MFVRAKEEDNNHYLQILKNSGIWDVSCSNETYDMIKIFSGFDLSKWIANNMNWENDLDSETKDYFQGEDLLKYLTW